MVETALEIEQAFDAASVGFVPFEQLLGLFINALREAGLEDDGQGVALWAAFSFHRNAQSGFTGSYAGADPEHPWPTDPRQIPPEVLEVWAAYAARAMHPGVRARLHHLLWEARKAGAFHHAQQAIESYQSAAAEFMDAPERGSGQVRACQSLVTAQDLAASLGQTALEGSVRGAMMDLVDVFLDDEDDAPGLVIRLLRALSVRRPVDARTLALLDRACDRYAADAFVLVDLLELRRGTEPDCLGPQVVPGAASSAPPGGAVSALPAARPRMWTHLKPGDKVSTGAPTAQHSKQGPPQTRVGLQSQLC